MVSSVAGNLCVSYASAVYRHTTHCPVSAINPAETTESASIFLGNGEGRRIVLNSAEQPSHWIEVMPTKRSNGEENEVNIGCTIDARLGYRGCGCFARVTVLTCEPTRATLSPSSVAIIRPRCECE